MPDHARGVERMPRIANRDLDKPVVNSAALWGGDPRSALPNALMG